MLDRHLHTWDEAAKMASTENERENLRNSTLKELFLNGILTLDQVLTVTQAGRAALAYPSTIKLLQDNVLTLEQINLITNQGRIYLKQKHIYDLFKQGALSLDQLNYLTEGDISRLAILNFDSASIINALLKFCVKYKNEFDFSQVFINDLEHSEGFCAGFVMRFLVGAHISDNPRRDPNSDDLAEFARGINIALAWDGITELSAKQKSTLCSLLYQVTYFEHSIDRIQAGQNDIGKLIRFTEQKDDTPPFRQEVSYVICVDQNTLQTKLDMLRREKRMYYITSVDHAMGLYGDLFFDPSSKKGMRTHPSSDLAKTVFKAFKINNYKSDTPALIRIHIFAAQDAKPEAYPSHAAFLADSVVNPDPTTERTALHFAAQGGDTQSLLEFIKKGCSVDAEDKDNCATPFQLAAFHQQTNILKILLDHGANPSMENASLNNYEGEAWENAKALVHKIDEENPGLFLKITQRRELRNISNILDEFKSSFIEKGYDPRLTTTTPSDSFFQELKAITIAETKTNYEDIYTKLREKLFEKIKPFYDENKILIPTDKPIPNLEKICIGLYEATRESPCKNIIGKFKDYLENSITLVSKEETPKSIHKFQ